MATDLRCARGQATIETMLIAFLGVVFMAVAFQFYLVNRSVNRTLVEVHSNLLSGMWKYNSKSYDYSADVVKVIWTAAHGVPSASSVPRVGLLQDDLPEDLHIYSDAIALHGDPDDDCEPTSPPCKRTKAGGGLNAGRSVVVDVGRILGIRPGQLLRLAGLQRPQRPCRRHDPA